MSLIASGLDFEDLHRHLNRFTEAILPGDEEMILAFWDPSILGTLVGQADDATLHMPGPVLSEQQRADFLSASAAWWYWGRTGQRHLIRPTEKTPSKTAQPLKLTQAQVDALVEASVPDHILGYIQSNQPQLLATLPQSEHHGRVRRHLQEARQLNLLGMKDLLDYICAALIRGEQLQQDSVIGALLQKVRMRQMSLTQALEQFP